MHLGAVSLLVADYDAAIAWFTQALGFALLEDTDMGGGKRWVKVAPSGGQTAMILAKASSPEQIAQIGRQGGDRVWLFLNTDDFARDHARMTSAGVEFEEAPRVEPYGTVAVWRDPFGNRWDLIEAS